jgi:hypothetical protein
MNEINAAYDRYPEPAAAGQLRRVGRRRLRNPWSAYGFGGGYGLCGAWQSQEEAERNELRCRAQLYPRPALLRGGHRALRRPYGRAERTSRITSSPSRTVQHGQPGRRRWTRPQRAVNLSPGTQKYAQLLQQIASGARAYDDMGSSFGFNPAGANNRLCPMCAAALLCSLCSGGRFVFYPFLLSSHSKSPGAPYQGRRARAFSVVTVPAAVLSA